MEIKLDENEFYYYDITSYGHYPYELRYGKKSKNYAKVIKKFSTIKSRDNYVNKNFKKLYSEMIKGSQNIDIKKLKSANKVNEAVSLIDKAIDNLKDAYDLAGDDNVHDFYSLLIDIHADMEDRLGIISKSIKYEKSGMGAITIPKIKSVDTTEKYYHFRFIEPSLLKDLRYPAWANNVANSVFTGARVIRGKYKSTGTYTTQAVLIPNDRISEAQAKNIANTIYARIKRK